MVDAIIGLTLVNALPHYIFGITGQRMLSLFGPSPRANLAYAALNLTVSIGLYLATHGVGELATDTRYLGGLFVAITYGLTGHLWFRWFNPPPA